MSLLYIIFLILFQLNFSCPRQSESLRVIFISFSQLTCARELKSHEAMATAHACLAVTNGDLLRYDTALFHYGKETELRSNTGAYNPEEVTLNRLVCVCNIVELTCTLFGEATLV